MKMECVERVGDIQKQKSYTFDAEKEADVRFVRELLYLTEGVPFGVDLSEGKTSKNIEHAKKEFKAAGYTPLNEDQEDGPNKWIQQNLIELLGVFSKQGHSGFSAGYCINAFNKLARFEPLTPLTGDDWEWQEVSENLWQNIRCGRVFKDETGQAYDIDGKVFVDPDGCAFTSGDSKVGVTFPYTPKTEYVNVEERQEG